MKAAETKTTATTSQTLQAKGEEQQPFFQAERASSAFEGGSPAFFSAGSGDAVQPKPFFSKPFIQTKLTIGQPGDKYEQEADTMADEVVQRMADGDQLAGGRSAAGSGARVQMKCAECAAEKQEEGIAPKLQLKSIFESNEEPAGGQVQRKCEACTAEKIQPMRIQCMGEEEEPELQAKGAVPGLQASADLESRLNSTKGSGTPLSDETRSAMESSFGTDFSGVRVHTNSGAVQMNQELGAQAFTHGNDVYFNSGKYDTGSTEGNRLLGHELTHVVQQGATEVNEKPFFSSGAIQSARIAGQSKEPLDKSIQAKQNVVKSSVTPHVIQRAQFNVGSISVNVDYTGLNSITIPNLVSEIESRFIIFTSAADASAIHVALITLTDVQKTWVLYALDLLQDNTQSPLHDRLNKTVAVQNLIRHAPSASHTFPGSGFDSEREALRASGWFEIALSANLGDPSAADRTSISHILNPPTAGGPGAALDTASFHARMDPAVRHFINNSDPSHWPSTGTGDLPTLQTIGNEILNEAKTFFSPYADTSRTTVFGLNPAFQIGPNIFSVTAIPAATISPATRVGYLRNRAGMVGRNTETSDSRFSDVNIFHDVNYDGSVAHQVELETLITNLLADITIVDAVNRLIQHTGRQSGSGASTRIGLSTEFNSAVQNNCQARWASIRTLCHEVMHALAHPEFEANISNPSVGAGHILLEGFTEVLGVQLFNQGILPKASGDPAFKGRLEAGISPPACPAPKTTKVGYGAFGAGAQGILNLASVTDDHFRAAYFLGQVHLIGL